MNLKQWNFARRLGASFTALVLLAAMVGGLGLWQMSRINGMTREMADDWLPSVKVLAEMRNMANQIRRTEPDLLFATEANEKAEIEETLRKRLVALTEIERRYRTLISSPEENELWRETERRRDAYLATQELLLKHARNGEAGLSNRLAGQAL